MLFRLFCFIFILEMYTTLDRRETQKQDLFVVKTNNWRLATFYSSVLIDSNSISRL